MVGTAFVGRPLRHESWEKRRSYDQCFSVGPDAGRLSKRSAANAEARYSTARWSNIPSLGFARVPSNGTGDTEIACEFRGASRSRRRRIHFRPILSGPITYPSQEQGLDAFSFGQAEIGCQAIKLKSCRGSMVSETSTSRPPAPANPVPRAGPVPPVAERNRASGSKAGSGSGVIERPNP